MVGWETSCKMKEEQGKQEQRRSDDEGLFRKLFMMVQDANRCPWRWGRNNGGVLVVVEVGSHEGG